MAPVLVQLAEDFPNDLQIIYRHFPLIGEPDNILHDKAALATQAAEAAGRQGMFWELHELLYDKQSEWNNQTPEEFTTWVIAEAETLGMDAEQFETDMLSTELTELAQNAWHTGLARGFSSTPYLLLDDRPVPGDYLSYTALYQIIGEFLIPLSQLTDKQFNECPKMNIDRDKIYTAILKTDLGDIVLALYPDSAPFTVNNFVFLAENGWYDNNLFHRVIPDFVAQAGDPSGTGMGGPGYLFANEIDPDLSFDRPGLLGMANSGPNSNGSQFFITYDATPHLDGQYTIFGEVVEGMDVVEKIATPLSKDDPENLPKVYIQSVTIEVK
jgi:cyclophilin family peptidyl-prolyl cis-trans isomerase